MNIKESIRTLIGTLFRLFGLSTEKGLRTFGNPDENSPVFVTSNFDLTVKRVSKHLKNLDCYLMVAESKGINVWCAACGGIFNAHSIISAIKISKIGEKVKHRTLILPQLSAPGVDTELIKKETGWRCRWGPVYTKDIPKYVENGFKKTETMRLAKFDLIDRLDAGIGSLFFFFVLIAASLLIFQRFWLDEFVILGLSLFFLMFGCYPYILGRSGWIKVLWCEALLILGYLIYIFIFKEGPLINLFYGGIVIVLLIGIEFGGIAPTYRSNLDPFLARIGIRRLGSLELKGSANKSAQRNSKD